MGMEDTTSEGRMWAMLSYGGLLVGLPIAIVPVAQKNDQYALTHGKNALALYITFMVTFFVVFMIAMVAGTITCGLTHLLFFPLMLLMLLWPVGAALHGLVLTSSGSWSEPFGVFGLGERIFGGVKIDSAKEPARLTDKGDEQTDEGPITEEVSEAEIAGVEASAEAEAKAARDAAARAAAEQEVDDLAKPKG